MTDVGGEQLELAAEKRDVGMAVVDKAASEEWKEYADDFILLYLMNNETLFVDDLWDAGLRVPKSSRALGPRIMAASKKGWMERSGDYRKSVRSNLSEKPVWKSHLHLKETND
jgi:hypothetical protein